MLMAFPMRRTAIARTMSTMTSPAQLRYVRAVQPLRFPSSDPEWEMSESMRHGRLCELLYAILRAAVGPAHSVGSDQFVYFDASNPRRKSAPDAFVKLDVPDEMFKTWKVWEKGAPDLAVEILSPSDTEEKLTWPQKMERYRAMGVGELVAFNTDARRGKRLRAWDRIEGDLVERIVVNDATPCRTLRLHWVVRSATATTGQTLAVALRLARDAAGTRLVPTPAEAAEAAADDATKEINALRAENQRLRQRTPKGKRSQP
jgi:Uma2 family endonuclease